MLSIVSVFFFFTGKELSPHTRSHAHLSPQTKELRHLSIIANAFAKLRADDDELFESVAQEKKNQKNTKKSVCLYYFECVLVLGLLLQLPPSLPPSQSFPPSPSPSSFPAYLPFYV